ncbi:helix-turn-helix domain-containing protein [Halomicrococcus sp. NG-SE-24]|uniref:helix-turn-helix domain-containing protein n=1 Tax=Halomicrococcus sp. NG-SE-24 TaxID=3436928 RepID=UPI003D96D024
MLITEFTLDHPILRQTLRSNRETTVLHERSNAVDDDRVRILFWAEGGDLDAFESALSEDPTVTEPNRVTTIDDRRLYQVELSGEGLESSVYPMLVEVGGVNHEVAATHEGWEFKTSFPDRPSLERFHDYCRNHDIDIELHRVYGQQSTGDGGEFGLTDEQRAALRTAFEAGYFEIPRDASLEELGDHLDISANAASNRLRRGTKTLLKNTVCDENRRVASESDHRA